MSPLHSKAWFSRISSLENFIIEYHISVTFTYMPRGGSSRSIGSLIKDQVGLAFVHGCQFTTVSRLLHQVHNRYRFSLLYLCQKATILRGYSNRRTEMKI